jgi:hypothetical protein
MSYPYGGFESARRTEEYSSASSSESDEELKKRLMKKDKEFNEKQRREFLERREEKPKGKFEKLKETVNEYAAPVKEAGDKLGKKFTEAKENVEVYKQSREVAKFQKAEQKIERASAIHKAAEIRKYGRELTQEERDRLVQFKIDEDVRKAERKEKIKERLSNARVQITELGEKSGNSLSQIGAVTKANLTTSDNLLATNKHEDGSQTAKQDPLMEIFSLKGFGGGSQSGQLTPRPAVDPLTSMFSLDFGNKQPQVPVAQPQQVKGRGQKVMPQQEAQPQTPQRDSLMEFFSIKGFGNVDDMFVKTANVFPQTQPQTEPKGKRKHKK